MGAGLRRAVAAAKRTNYPGTPSPQPGQRWVHVADPGSALVVVRIEEATRVKYVKGRRTQVTITAAVCAVYLDGIDVGRTTSIDVARMVPTSRGYRYVGEGPP